jgi:hypothetical protein
MLHCGKLITEADPEAAFAVDKKTIPYAFGSADTTEGITSPLQKRPPEFSGVAREAVSRLAWRNGG